MTNPLPAAIVAAFTPSQRATVLANYRAKRELLASRGLDTAKLDAAIAQVEGR